MSVTYAAERTLSVSEFRQVLVASGLGERRPIDDGPRLAAMLENADLTLVARDGDGKPIGIARCVTDFAYCLYCSELAVDRAHQGQGIGRRLLDEVVAAAPGLRLYLLLSAPAAVGFYERQGYQRHADAFIFHRGT